VAQGKKSKGVGTSNVKTQKVFAKETKDEQVARCTD
jgi:hypothetical protein